MPVPANDQRPFSYTDSESGYVKPKTNGGTY
jgi:hypothetical protein